MPQVVPLRGPVPWREQMERLRSELEAMAVLLAELAERARREAAPEAELLSAGGWVLDGEARELRGGRGGVGVSTRLTASEFKLARTLMEVAGHTVRREALMRRLYGGAGTEQQERNMDSLVNKLRRHLGLAPGEGGPIETVRGVGYRWKTEAACQ